MFRLLTLTVVVAGAASGAALADGGGIPGTVRTVSPTGSNLTYTTSPATRGHRTRVALLRGTRELRAAYVPGAFGIAVTTFGVGSSGEGVSHDGRTLVLMSARGASRFAVLDARTLALRRIVQLRGSFSYDALSPNGRTLFLIQQVPSRFSNRYYVRAYDLVRGRLYRKIVFDRREKWGLMSGMPVARATSRTGRWVYTLYTRPGGHPFVHALDAVHRRAVCIDLPWRGSQARIWGMKLALGPGRLVVHHGKERAAVIDTRRFRVSA